MGSQLDVSYKDEKLVSWKFIDGDTCEIITQNRTDPNDYRVYRGIADVWVCFTSQEGLIDPGIETWLLDLWHNAIITRTFKRYER